MRILIADPDRDLLKACSKLLSLHGHTATVCFEGAGALRLAAAETFDAVVLNRAIPRVRSADIVTCLHERNVPVIELPDRPVSTKLLMSQPLANAYLPFPFLPEELRAAVESVTEKAASAETLEYGDVRIPVARFSVEGTDIRLTADEIDVLKSLAAGEKTKKHGLNVYINALNQKCIAAGKKLRIVYQIKEGYRLVTDHEES